MNTVALIIAVVIIAIMLAMSHSTRLWAFGREMMFVVNLNRVVTLHYVNWCPHCKNMMPIWERVKQATVDSGIIYKEIDEDVAKTPGIKAYPTIRMVTERGDMVDYTGGPNFTTLRNWVVSPLHRE